MKFSMGAWLLSSAIGAIVLNLFASYLKDAIDKVGRAIFGKWISRNEKARAEFSERLDVLRGSRSAREATVQTASALRAASTQLLILSVGCICFAILFALISVPGSGIGMPIPTDADHAVLAFRVARTGTLISVVVGFFSLMFSIHVHGRSAYYTRLMYAYWDSEGSE